MANYAENLIEEREGLATRLEQMTNAAGTEKRDLTDKEKEEFSEISKRCGLIDERLEDYAKAQESNGKFSALMGRIAGRQSHKESVETTNAAAALTWGGQFTKGLEGRSYAGRGTSEIIDVDFNLEQRAAIMTSNLAIPNNVYEPIQPALVAPLLAACGKEPVSSGAVEWTEWGPDTEASIVAETALKPEATFTAVKRSGVLTTLAHWVPITRQASEDSVRLKAIVDGKLKRGVYKKIESNIHAALAAATLTEVTYTAPDTDNKKFLAAIRGAIGTVESVGYVPNCIALNPADYARFDIAVMGNAGGATRRSDYWGVPIAASGYVAAGTAYVGDFFGVTVFGKGDAQVYMTDSHADYFIRNQLVVLGETRALSAVTEPSAVVRVKVGA